MYAIEFVCEPMDNGAIQWTCVSTPLPKEIKLPVLISSPPLFRAHRMPTLPLYVPLCVPSFFACPSSVFPLFASLPRLFSCCFRPASASVNVLMQMCIFSMLGASMTVDRQFLKLFLDLMISDDCETEVFALIKSARMYSLQLMLNLLKK